MFLKKAVFWLSFWLTTFWSAEVFWENKKKTKRKKKRFFENKKRRKAIPNNQLNKRKVMSPWLAKIKTGSHPPWEGPPRQRSSPLHPTKGWTRGLPHEVGAQGFLGVCPGTLGLLLLDPLKDHAQSQSVGRAPV